jgi:hypothetical protein
VRPERKADALGEGEWRGKMVVAEAPGAAAVRVLREKKKRGEMYGAARGSAGRTPGAEPWGEALSLRVF